MKNTYFLHLLLTCGKNQGKALLETADNKQVNSVVNVVYNLTLNSSVLNSHSKKLLSIHKKLIAKLLSKNKSIKSKYTIIRNNSVELYNLLISAKNTLLKVLK